MKDESLSWYPFLSLDLNGISKWHKIFLALPRWTDYVDFDIHIGWKLLTEGLVVSILSDLCNKLLPFELLVFLQQISMVKFNLYSSSSHWLFRPLPYCLRLGLGLGIDSNGPRVQRRLTIGEHGLALGMGGELPMMGYLFQVSGIWKGGHFTIWRIEKGECAYCSLSSIFGDSSGSQRGGGGGRGGVAGALQPHFFPRSPEPHRFVARSPNIILL